MYYSSITLHGWWPRRNVPTIGIISAAALLDKSRRQRSCTGVGRWECRGDPALLPPPSHLPAFPPSRLPAFPPSRLPAFPPSRLPAFPPSRLPAFPPSHRSRDVSTVWRGGAGSRHPIRGVGAAVRLRQTAEQSL